jgi:hypothetical protein
MLNLLKQTIAPILRKHMRSPSARSDSSAGSDPQSPKDEDEMDSIYINQPLEKKYSRRSGGGGEA